MLQNDSKGEERREEERKGAEPADYVTPFSVLCLSQCRDVSFLTALVSNLASLLFLALDRQSEKAFFPCIFMRHLSLLITVKYAHLRMDTISRTLVQLKVIFVKL